jgi:hypothetical protein
MPKPRVQLELRAGAALNSQTVVLSDDMQGSAPFINLNDINFAGKAEFAIVSAVTGPNGSYVTGDHVLLMAKPQLTATDTIALDPGFENGANLDLSKVDKGFSGRIQAVSFVLNNQGPDGAFARVRLGNAGDELDFPSLVFYPFEQGGAAWRYIDLNIHYFSQKTNWVQVDYLGSDPNASAGATLYDSIPPVNSAQHSYQVYAGAQVQLTSATGWQSRAQSVTIEPADPL